MMNSVVSEEGHEPSVGCQLLEKVKGDNIVFYM